MFGFLLLIVIIAAKQSHIMTFSKVPEMMAFSGSTGRNVERTVKKRWGMRYRS
jgi:hypothetical protein